jgi:hypothetical protein
MKHCRHCRTKYPEYSMPPDLLKAMGQHVALDICPACMDLASRKNGIVLSWSARFGEAASTADIKKPTTHAKPASTLSMGSSKSSPGSHCESCGTWTVLNGKCFNPKHDSHDLG